MSDRLQRGPRIIDRVFHLLGSPSAVNHDKSLRAADEAVKAKAEVREKARRLTEAIRELDATWNHR